MVVWVGMEVVPQKMHPILFFSNSQIQHSSLVRRDSPDVLQTDDKKKEVLERFNGDWRDCTYRDVMPVAEKYSEDQRNYFLTPPKERKELIRHLLQKMHARS